MKDDASPEIQRQRCEDYIKFLKNSNGESGNFTIIENFADEGISAAATINRPAYQKIWNLIAAQKIGFIIATEFSRLSRNVGDFIDLINHCEKHGVRLIIIGLNLDTSSAVGKMVALILMSTYQAEREICGNRVRENAFSRLVNDGKINGSAPILGLERDPDKAGHFRINNDEVITLEKILLLLLKLPGRRKVLEEAKRIGLTGKSGKELTLKTINTIFANIRWRYRGKWYVNKENEYLENQDHLPENKRFKIIPLPHGPVIDLKLLDQVEAKMKDTLTKHKRSGIDNYIYLLSHILYDENGNRLTGQSAEGRVGTIHRYYGNTAPSGGGGTKCKLRVRCDELDKAIIDRIKSYLINSKTFEQMLETALKRRQLDLHKIESNLSSYRGKMAELEKKEQDLQEQFLNMENREKRSGEFLDWIEAQVKNVAKDKERYQGEVQYLEGLKRDIIEQTGLDNIRVLVKDFVNRFDTLTGTEKRNLIEKVISKVVIRSDQQIEIHVHWEPVHATRAAIENTRCNHRNDANQNKVGIEGDRVENGGSEGT
ncbi:MAG: recombinase family protein [Oligoflexia bacterium]|nr:recombinase family protein [Oligoflexia bacterium]